MWSLLEPHFKGNRLVICISENGNVCTRAVIDPEIRLEIMRQIHDNRNPLPGYLIREIGGLEFYRF